VGQAIKGRRDQVFVFTKCGTLRDENKQWYESLKPASIRREVESSLRNLQIETIDLYQFHDPDPQTPIEESWTTVQALIGEGKNRYAGLSNHTVDLMERAAAIAPITSNQHQYSLLYQKEAAAIFPYSQQNNIGVLAWSPLASGFLVDDFALDRLDANDFRHGHWLAQSGRHDRLQTVRSQLLTIAHDHSRTLRELAIAWVLANTAVAAAIIGIRNEQEARQIADGVGWQLTGETKRAIEEVMEIWEDS
jgi:aryl-alcohol dehydrogenase-like predicted oxidoreductase